MMTRSTGNTWRSIMCMYYLPALMQWAQACLSVTCHCQIRKWCASKWAKLCMLGHTSFLIPLRFCSVQQLLRRWARQERKFLTWQMDTRSSSRVWCGRPIGHAGMARLSQISCSHLCFFVTRKLGQGDVKMARGKSSTQDFQLASSEPAT